jgi:Zn-dependent peptidase ImmA (M78 family)
MSSSLIEYQQHQKNKDTALYRLERQANYAAAAFLMPRQAVIFAAQTMLQYDGKYCMPFGYSIKPTIKEMGKLFGVNSSPMTYRLQELNIINRNFDPCF